MITQWLFRTLDKRVRWLLLALLFVTIAVPVSNLLIPEGNPLHLPNYAVPLFGKYLNYAMLALALDLVWGYVGILSLGHAAFFALGAYAMGMYLMRQIGARGVYANPVLPDFMVFLNYKELPWFWYGFNHWWFAFLMVMLVPGLLAFAFGVLAFRSRVTGVYLSIITQAMTYALLLAFFRNDLGFGGNNGLTDFKDILGFNVQAANTRAALFAASGIFLMLTVVICSAIVTSKFGKVMISVRDAESRTRFIGWRPENVKLFAFVVSAVIAGIAGALYVPQVGIINPGEFDPANSIEAVIWVAVGGRGTIVGPVIGAVLVNVGKSIFTGALPELWLFALGALFIASTLFLPRGILGVLDNASPDKRIRILGTTLGVVIALGARFWLGGSWLSYALLVVGALIALASLLWPSRIASLFGRSEPPASGGETAGDVKVVRASQPTPSGWTPPQSGAEPQPAE